MLSDTEIDVIVIRGKITLTKTGDDAVELPLTLDIMADATVAPIGSAVPPKTGTPERGIPRFASDTSQSVTVIDSSSAQTVMEVAYVLSLGEFDTGIAVSNMTKDQAGAVHFKLYMNGQELSYSTPSMIGPQTTTTMLLSRMLALAGHTGSFTGYMVITADFTAADATVYVSDFTKFSAASTVRIK